MLSSEGVPLKTKGVGVGRRDPLTQMVGNTEEMHYGVQEPDNASNQDTCENDKGTANNFCGKQDSGRAVWGPGGAVHLDCK